MHSRNRKQEFETKFLSFVKVSISDRNFYCDCHSYMPFILQAVSPLVIGIGRNAPVLQLPSEVGM